MICCNICISKTNNIQQQQQLFNDPASPCEELASNSSQMLCNRLVYVFVRVSLCYCYQRTFFGVCRAALREQTLQITLIFFLLHTLLLAHRNAVSLTQRHTYTQIDRDFSSVWLISLVESLWLGQSRAFS